MEPGASATNDRRPELQRMIEADTSKPAPFDDDLVASHLEDRLLQPERLETILATVLDRRQERSERQHEHIGELNRRATEAEARLKRLYDAIEAGVADVKDRALKDRIDGLKAIRDQAKADAERARAMLENSGSKAVTPEMVRAFAGTARRPIRLEGLVIAATTFARSPSALRSQMARSGSWDRGPGCYRCQPQKMAQIQCPLRD